MNNLVLILSVINTPNKPLSYSNIRSVFSREERFKQTKKTIESVKEKIPNNKLMIVECTDFTKEEKDYFDKECDYVLNLWERKDLHNNIFGLFKSLGEGTQMIEALNYIQKNHIRFDNLIKISGRYWLNEIFDYGNFKNNKMVFKHNENNVVTTTLYKLPISLIIPLYKYLIINLSRNSNIMYEILFTNFLKNYKVNYVDIIGVCGNCTTKGEWFSF